MKKIIFCISIFFAQGILAQIPFIPFTPSIYSYNFTQSLDAFGNEIVVSAGYSHDPSKSRVFVFQKNGSTVSEETYFTPTDAALNDNFGRSVSINNDFIAAGSPLNDQAASNAGAVYMYRKLAGNWVAFQKITAFDSAADDNFGSFVKVIGNQLFIISPNNEAVGMPASTNNGAVYVYKFNGSSWIFSQKITPTGNNKFGSKIAVSDDRLVIKSDSDFATYAYDGTNWNFSYTLSTTGTYKDFNVNNNQLFILFEDTMSIYDAGANGWNLNTSISSLKYNDTYPTSFEVHNDVMLVCLNFHSLLYTARTPTKVFKKINGIWNYQEIIYGGRTC